MNIENLKNKKIEDLATLKAVIQDVCEDYAKELTDYATMQRDPQFQKMDSATNTKYNERIKYVDMLNIVKQIIKEKLMEIYNE